MFFREVDFHSVTLCVNFSLVMGAITRQEHCTERLITKQRFFLGSQGTDLSLEKSMKQQYQRDGSTLHIKCQKQKALTGALCCLVTA